MTDKTVKDHCEAWMIEFIERRFPNGLDGQIGAVIREIMFDSYVDGVKFGHYIAETESKILGSDGKPATIYWRDSAPVILQ